MVDTFRGNMIFSSNNQLHFHTTSRRDDLISLCYLLVFVINEGKIPNIDIYNNVDKRDSFKSIRDAKLSHTLEDLCNEQDGTADLIEFLQECFSYRYKDRPKYDKLRAILQGLIELEDISEIDEEEEFKEPLEKRVLTGFKKPNASN